MIAKCKDFDPADGTGAAAVYSQWKAGRRSAKSRREVRTLPGFFDAIDLVPLAPAPAPAPAAPLALAPVSSPPAPATPRKPSRPAAGRSEVDDEELDDDTEDRDTDEDDDDPSADFAPPTRRRPAPTRAERLDTGRTALRRVFRGCLKYITSQRTKADRRRVADEYLQLLAEAGCTATRPFGILRWLRSRRCECGAFVPPSSRHGIKPSSIHHHFRRTTCSSLCSAKQNVKAGEGGVFRPDEDYIKAEVEKLRRAHLEAKRKENPPVDNSPRMPRHWVATAAICPRVPGDDGAGGEY